MSERSELVERMAWSGYKRSFEDGSVITQYKYIHSVLGAISFSFFLALFSAGSLGLHADVELQIAMACFAVSLVGNVSLFMFHHFSENERESLWETHRTKSYQMMENFSWLFPVVGAMALICFFSIISFIAAILTIVCFLVGAKLSSKAVRRNGEQISQARLRAIEIDDINRLEWLGRFKFKRRLSGSEVFFNQYEYRVEVKSDGLESSLRDFVCLQHQAVVGDSIESTASGSLLRVVDVIHSKDYTTLLCMRTA